MFKKEGTKAPALVTTFILFNLLVFGELKAAYVLPLNSSNIEEEPGFSWDIATDNVAAFSIIPMLDLESIVKGPSEPESYVKHGSSRQKRASRGTKRVFKAVAASDITTTPYSGAVRISNTCSGTLISEYHVLTAAHCVHTGKQFRFRLSQLKVGVVKGIGRFLWMKVAHIHVSKAWKKSKGVKKRTSLDSDYAVLRLKHKHGQEYFKPQASKDRLKSKMMFNSFPANKRGTLWHSSCRVEKVIPGSLLLSRCIASEGSSGSGIYVPLASGQHAVTGVVSANIQVKKGKNIYSCTITNKLTSDKVKKICRWAGRNDC